MGNTFMRQLYSPGLQLFMENDPNADILYSTSNINKSLKATNKNDYSQATCVNNQDILASIKERDISLPKSVHFNDSSPTIVSDSPYLTNHGFENFVSPFWNNIIESVFKDLPYNGDNQFIEEFKYNVISSSFLHDLNSYIHPIKPKSSILDFNNKDNEKLNKTIKLSKKTRYGKIAKKVNYRFVLIGTLDYSSTVFSCLKVMYSLKKLNKSLQRNTKRIVIVLLIFLYLSFQQTNLRVHCIRAKCIEVIKEMTPLLENLDTLISQYHLQYKELNIKKNSAVLKENERLNLKNTLKNKSSIERTDISTIHDILHSTTDQMFFKINSTIRQWLTCCDFDNLSSYCEMFDVSPFELRICLTQHCSSLSQNISNIHILRKFLFCCLLSILNDSKIQSKTIDSNFQLKILRLFKCSKNQKSIRMNECSILNKVNSSLISLMDTTKILVSSLQENKSVFKMAQLDCFPSIITTSYDQTTIKRQQNLIYETLETLEDQIEIIQKYNKSNYDFSSVENRLRHLINSVHDFHTDQISQIPQQSYSVSRNVSDTRASSYGKGFSLDVLRAPSPLDASLNLNRKVEFIKIANSDEEDDGGFVSSDENYYNEDETIIQCELQPTMENDTSRGISVHYQSMRQLSDEQLQRQLQDEILKFSAENKKSRENLRTEKSFELLKRCRKHNNEQLSFDDTKTVINTNNGNVQSGKNNMKTNSNLDKNHHLCVSEEGIPILYNIREYS
ncbi:similar to Saccharomyces cerevisiae YMR163C INP2 Peroxisome-specific receptor important for peroxisome inheritance [Maudiozyma saulgeensis]|uniref:Inheritance of peroxisomes protein 2 n=1 Tax=Maudiozyma saulgeensis TaxID=1789683 RepID=A0A1X7R0I6_9SACH|nr:similar to Saccharomyces cerevisiae YMR163C INP2 Peroxisome-specific receptor important for peroxisome inheritance [Kazachstania saulgeensis]